MGLKQMPCYQVKYHFSTIIFYIIFRSHEQRMKGTGEENGNEVIPEEKALKGNANVIDSKQAIVLLVILPALQMR